MSFSVNIAKCLRLLILKNFCERLLFDCFNGLHFTDGSRSRFCEDVRLHRLHGPSCRSFFVFKSPSLALNQVPTQLRKLKTSFQMICGRFRRVQVVLRLFQVVLDCFKSFQIVLDGFMQNAVRDFITFFSFVRLCMKFNTSFAFIKFFVKNNTYFVQCCKYNIFAHSTEDFVQTIVCLDHRSIFYGPLS